MMCDVRALPEKAGDLWTPQAKKLELSGVDDGIRYCYLCGRIYSHLQLATEVKHSFNHRPGAALGHNTIVT